MKHIQLVVLSDLRLNFLVCRLFVDQTVEEIMSTDSTVPQYPLTLLEMLVSYNQSQACTENRRHMGKILTMM